jgi:hypothetical protein
VSSKRYSRGILYKAVLVALFVAAQTTVLSHVDLDSHSQEAPCAICLSISTFGSANVANLAQALALAASVQPLEFQPVFFATRQTEHHRARAPPFVS